MLELLQYRAWALSEVYFAEMYPIVSKALSLGHDLVKKKTLADFDARIELLMSHPDIDSPKPGAGPVQLERDQNSGLLTTKANGKTIALIPVIGPLTKYSDLCTMGMQTYQGLINRANAASNIDGIVLIMDTPGGTVDGTPEFGLTVRDSLKPVGIFGDNQVASAGLWIASQASVIVGNKNNPTQFGSIGVLMALPNYQNVMDAGNAPQVEIFRAEQSSKKVLVNSIEKISDEGRATLQAELNGIASDFISTVKAGRGDKLNGSAPGLFNGNMFNLNESKQHGIIDSIGTLQTAVNKVAELARAQQKSTSVSPTGGQVNTQMKLTKLSALLGAAMSLFHSGSPDKEVNLTVEQAASLEASEKKLSDQEEEIAQLKISKEAAEQKATQFEAQVTELTAQVATLTTAKTTLEAKVAEQKLELDKKPTGHVTTIIPKESGEAQQANQEAIQPEANKYRTSVDAEADEIRKSNKNASIIK